MISSILKYLILILESMLQSTEDTIEKKVNFVETVSHINEYNRISLHDVPRLDSKLRKGIDGVYYVSKGNLKFVIMNQNMINHDLE